MKDSKALPWIAGTAVIAVIVLAFTWLVVVTPARDGAATDRAATVQQDMENGLLEVQNARLASEFANLADYKAQLVEAQKQIPATIDQPTFSRELDNLATQSGVWISNISFSTSLKLADAAPRPTASASASPSAEAAPGSTGDSTTSGSTIPSSMYGVPVSVTVVGAPKDVQSFVDRLQTGEGRVVLVTDVEITRQEEKASTDGSPSIKDGDFEMVVSGLTYLLQDTSTATQPAG